ncbi:MAG: capsid cement protein [Paracoccaceae bacterium]|nr:capsid cement protein [Paracoccaceae bacterium]
MIPSFTKSYEASAAILGNRIVRFSDVAASTRIAMAAVNTDPAIGVSDRLGAEIGDQCDIHVAGLASVELGAAVTAGAPLMSDASGRAIPAIAAAASTRRVIGFAHAPGVIGDIIDVWLAPGLLDRA